RVERPDRLEAALAVVGGRRRGVLPAEQARRVAGRVDDDRPLVRERVPRADRDLDRPVADGTRLGEVREDERGVGEQREPLVAALDLAVEPLALERGE